MIYVHSFQTLITLGQTISMVMCFSETNLCKDLSIRVANKHLLQTMPPSFYTRNIEDKRGLNISMLSLRQYESWPLACIECALELFMFFAFQVRERCLFLILFIDPSCAQGWSHALGNLKTHIKPLLHSPSLSF